MRLFNPSLSLEVVERVLIHRRYITSDSRYIRLVVKPSIEILINGERVPRGEVMVYTGAARWHGTKVIGQIQYVQAFSKDNGEHWSLSLSDLLKMKAEHIEKNGKREPFPLEHLIEPASFSIKLFVQDQTFEDLLKADLQKSRMYLDFTVNPEVEGSVGYEHDLVDDLVFVWDQTKEDHIPAETFTFATQSKAGEAISEPIALPVKEEADDQEADLSRKATMEALAGILNTLKWCLWLLVALFILALIKH